MVTTNKLKIEKILFKEDGTFPNNNKLPLIIYRNALEEEERTPLFMEQTFKVHHWVHAWQGGIYDYQHYHSRSHEVLGVCSGEAMVQFGGTQGAQLELHAGDVVVIPAGVAHKCLRSTDDFNCVGAYPQGQKYDINYGKFTERPETDKHIRNVSLPQADPVFGLNGPLKELWSGAAFTVIDESSKEKVYRSELQHQLEDSFSVQNRFTGVKRAYGRTFFDKWIEGGFLVLLEVVFYLLFIGMAILAIGFLINDPTAEVLHESIAVYFNVPYYSSADWNLIEFTSLLLATFLLGIALMLRGIRIRNSTIDSLLTEINRDIQIEEEREERIKKVL